MTRTGATNQKLASAALRNAVPYLRLFQGRTFVIKAGGEVFQKRETAAAFLEQVSILHRLGIHVVLVHGGGPQISETSERLGIEPRFVEGRRVTCENTLDATRMALGGIVSTEIVATFRSLDTPAVGVSCVDAGLIVACRRPVRTGPDGERIDYGHVGDIETVDPHLIERLLEEGFLPVVSPLCADGDGAILNVNADSVAARLAMALEAEKLIYLTGAPGILADPDDASSLVSCTDVDGIARLQEEGALSRGMLPKAASLVDALRGGVTRVHVISHRVDDSLLIEVFTNEGSGTLVVLERARLAPAEQTGEA